MKRERERVKRERERGGSPVAAAGIVARVVHAPIELDRVASQHTYTYKYAGTLKRIRQLN